MRKPRHLRFTTWASGLADFDSCGGDIKPFPGMPKTLANLLKRPEWRGATVERSGEMLVIRHPAGTELRIKADAFDDTCAEQVAA